MSVRVGTGFDVHPLAPGRPCVLGGVPIPHEAGPVGHSDGDAVLHAVADALLGAAGLGDIGTLFPDDDPEWKDSPSSKLVTLVMDRVQAAGFRVGNVDVVVAADVPRIAPHRQEMRETIARLLRIQPAEVGVKGKTLEGMGALANGAGIAAHAVCLLETR